MHGLSLGRLAGEHKKPNVSHGRWGEIPNQGQKSLRLADLDRGVEISSVFQIAKVTRPLMSVGRTCDEGKQVVFDKTTQREFSTRMAKRFADSNANLVAYMWPS